jgi:uncharacterized protein YpbB
LPDYLTALILYVIKKFKGERSINAIYHLLQGKKSSQTIQDAHLYGVTNIFGTVPQFTRLHLQSIVERLVAQNWIEAQEKPEVFSISAEGMAQLEETFSIPVRLNGWKYQNMAHTFWSRLNLLIQTLSYIIRKEKRFYPIQRHPKTQQAIKYFLQKNKQNREEMAAQLYGELVHILEVQSGLHQQIFVRKLTGINRIGDTFEQIAKTMDLDQWYVRFLFLECIHVMLEEVKKDAKQYGLLAMLMDDLDQSNLTHSTQMTLEYIKEGRSLSEIAAIRHLKHNTIEDHLVEIVVTNKTFSIRNYVPDVVEKKISEAIQVLQTKQLKVIKQWLADDTISFFQIRLVLAKIGDDL